MKFIEKLIGDQPFLLVGESYGGYLSRGVLSKIPQSILGMLFICPVIYPELSKRLLPPSSIHIKNQDLWKTLKNEERIMFESEFFLFNDQTYKRGITEVLIGNLKEDKDIFKKISKRYSFSNWFVEPTFEKPSMFLVGKQDSVIGYKDAFSLMEKYKMSTSYIALNGAGRNLQIESPHIFNTMLTEWLNIVDKS
ncbi:alpha/beta hydrolase [Priestia sp. FSL W8-0524]|uniref:alpha/beta hydrolase n=1 Tax=Priestia sp. FSL W8-0524 TaxID=2954625 RepID=UPI0030F8420F